MSKSSVQKGQELEDYVVEQLRESGLDPRAKRAFKSGATNSEKSDIWTSLMVLGQNIGIECKNQALLRMGEWWRQTRKLQSLSREPVLVYKELLEPMGETKVVIYLETFLELLKNQK